MDCLHCGKAFHDEWALTQLNEPKPIPNHTWFLRMTICPACTGETLNILRRRIHQGVLAARPEIDSIAYPQSTFRKPTPNEVPKEIRADYEEACKVLPISNKASAALSRRCLQAILRAHGYPQKDLAQQIDALLKEADPAKAIPTGLRDTIDAVRNFGNFSAHPITDQTSLQIIEVESGEAEWCLDILEEMFDHYYVKPAQATERKKALNEKLKAAGKPPSK